MNGLVDAMLCVTEKVLGEWQKLLLPGLGNRSLMTTEKLKP